MCKSSRSTSANISRDQAGRPKFFLKNDKTESIFVLAVKMIIRGEDIPHQSVRLTRNILMETSSESVVLPHHAVAPTLRPCSLVINTI